MCKESRSGLQSLKKYIMVFLVVAIVLTSLSVPTTVSVYAAPGGTLAEKVEESQNKTEETGEEFILTSDLYYPEYIAGKDAEGYTPYTGTEDIVVDLNTIRVPEDYKVEDYLVNSYTAVELEETYEGLFLNWNSSDLKWVEFSVDVATKGYYNIEIEYYDPKGSVQTPQRSLNIDGDLVFSESVTVDFQRLWKDSTPIDEEHKILNTAGDQVRPKQEEVYMWQSMRIQDHDGKYSAPLQFALDAGNHKIKFYYQYENIVIKSIKLVAPKNIPSYEEKLAEWKAAGYTNGTATLRIEAESVTYKSDTSLRVDGSSDPAATPSYEDGNRRLNVIGGSTWASSNQTLTWTVDLKDNEAGLYQLTLRAYAKYTDGIPVYRQVRINGEVPFKEFECYEVPFADWDCFALNKDEKPLLVYLQPGKNTIQMTVKLGALAEVMNALEKDANNLSSLVTDITKITSTNPDPNFEYQLDQKVPNLIARFQNIRDSFESQITRIQGLSEKRPAAINNFEMMQEQFDRILKNTDIIAKNYTDLTDAMANLATWIKSFSSLPMQVDYIEFIPPEEEVKVVKSKWWQKLSASFTAFMVSFTKNYDAVGGISDDPDAEQTVILDVWISRGKEWAEILKQLSDEEFYTEKGIAVNMNILPSGQLNASAGSVLLLALASGTAPDLAMGVASNLPVEYGMRGAIYDLSQFEDFEEVSDRFLDGIMIPFYFQDGYYGLPETMDFQCLYYRKDLLNAYDLEVPSTWNDVYAKILPILNNNGMDFYYAGGYNTFLFQNGGEFFIEDEDGVTQSAWEQAEAIAGFQQWTDLYTIYDVPVAADFYTRFRSGQIPIGIGGMDIYTKLVSAAPEISGKWGVSVIPGIMQEDGQVNRASGGSTSAAVILNTCENPDAAWEFLKWYTEAETQVSYANDIKSIIGPEAIWASANVEAFDALPWDAELEDVIKVYQNWYKDAPNVIGGYIVGRYLENARVAVVVENEPYRPSLEKAVKEINRELKKKHAEFERRAEFEAQKAAQSKE